MLFESFYFIIYPLPIFARMGCSACASTKQREPVKGSIVGRLLYIPFFTRDAQMRSQLPNVDTKV